MGTTHSTPPSSRKSRHKAAPGYRSAADVHVVAVTYAIVDLMGSSNVGPIKHISVL